MGEIVKFTGPPLPISSESLCSPKLADFVETLDKSSPTGPIRAMVLKSLVLSSPDRVDQPSAPAETLVQLRNPDVSSSSSSQEALPDPALPPSSVGFENSGGLLAQVTPDNHRPSGTTVIRDMEGDDESKVEQTELSRNSWSSTWSGSHEDPLKIKPTGVGAGLWNLGNSCYMNAILQCFTHTVPLIESLWSYKHSKPCNCGCEEFCVMQVLRDHIELALTSSGDRISPLRFVENLDHISSSFQRYHQEDAHELLQSFLDKLERCCLDPGNKSNSVSSQGANIVQRVFGNRLISRLCCCDCNSFSDTYEDSLCLSLGIEDASDLASALESFTRKEKLEDQLTCDRCKEKVSKEKQLMLDKLPLVATFHLKRFKNDGFFTEKIFKHVKFPLQLDLQPYMSGSQENEVSTTYHLYALVEHLGSSLTNGHYFSYVRSAHETWHKFDDSQVTRIEEGSVLSQDAYILFYAREGTPWFSSAFEQIKPLREANMPNSSSPKSVLDPACGEFVSEHGDENIDKPCDLVEEVFRSVENSASSSPEPQEEVLHSEEYNSNGYPFTEASEPPEAEDYDRRSIRSSRHEETESCVGHDRAATTSARVPLLEVQGKQKQQGSSFQIQRKHLETEKKKETLKLPLKSKVAEARDRDIAFRYLRGRPCNRARMLEAAMAEADESTGSPTKRIKTAAKALNR